MEVMDREEMKRQILITLHLARIEDPERALALEDFKEELGIEKEEVLDVLQELNEAECIIADVEGDDFGIIDVYCYLTEKGYEKLKTYYQ